MYPAIEERAMSTDVDAGLDEFIGTDVPLSPREQVEQMIADAEQDVQRHAEHLKRAKALLKAHKATLVIMQESAE
jgi:hypothetical protein